jgi:integrase
MKITNIDSIAKSIRIFVEDGIIKFDYRTKANVPLPKGKIGNRFRFSTGMKETPSSFKEIERNKTKLVQEHYEGLFQTLENKEIVLFEDVAFLALKEAEADRGKKDGTKDYENILKLDVLPFFGKLPLQDIKVKDIKAWVNEIAEQELSQSRFNKKYYVVKRVLDYACQNDYMLANPISHVKRGSKLFSKPKDKSTEYFSKEERNLILTDTCENGTAKEKIDFPFINTFIHVALLTGARTGEIMALKLEDIDFENNTITIQRTVRKGIIAGTKTGKNRTIPMIKTLKEALIKWIGTSNRVWLFPKTTIDFPYSDSRTIVDKYYKPLLARLNLKYRVLYNTRHSFASVAVENKIPISTVSKCLGHSVLSTTERFYLQFGNANQDDIRDQLENLTA